MISRGVVAARQLINVQLLVTYLKARLNKLCSTYCMTLNVTFVIFSIVYKLCFLIARCFYNFRNRRFVKGGRGQTMAIFILGPL